jgi:hypothetical protein
MLTVPSKSGATWARSPLNISRQGGREPRNSPVGVFVVRQDHLKLRVCAGPCRAKPDGMPGLRQDSTSLKREERPRERQLILNPSRDEIAGRPSRGRARGNPRTEARETIRSQHREGRHGLSPCSGQEGSPSRD